MRVYKDQGQVWDQVDLLLKYLHHLEAELFDLKFAQSADVMYICHPNHDARKLARTGHTAWTLTQIAFTDGPYLSKILQRLQ